MYMRIAPELYLKRLIVGGFAKVYELGKMFRNEGMDIKHNPEFTMMELYQAYADYHDMMDITEEIYQAAIKAAGVGDKIEYEGTEIDLTSPWERLTMLDAIKKYVGIDYDKMSVEDAFAAAKNAGVEIDESKKTWGNIVYETFDQLVECKLIQPVFITDYPVEVSPLAKRSVEDPRMTYRFEFFIYAREMGNAYSELNDPIDQKERFERQVKLRASGRRRSSDDGRRFRHRARIRYAADRRTGHRHRSYDYAAHRQLVHTRRNAVPHDETQEIRIFTKAARQNGQQNNRRQNKTAHSLRLV